MAVCTLPCPKASRRTENMKRTKTKTDAEREQLRRQMCEELGDDAVKQLWNAYRLTAAAIYRRAKQRAEAELREAEE